MNRFEKWTLLVIIILINASLYLIYSSLGDRITDLETKVVSLEIKINSNKLLAQETMRKVTPDEIALREEVK